jgi:hypothetical protein
VCGPWRDLSAHDHRDALERSTAPSLRHHSAVDTIVAIVHDSQVARQPPRPAADQGWTYRDEVLLHTLVTVRQTMDGTLDQRPFLTSRFALNFEGERLLASGYYRQDWWGAIGDGSYTYNSTLVAGTGALGLGLAAGTLYSSHRSKVNARSQALRDATHRWRPVDAGDLHISNCGFYLAGPIGLRFFGWASIRQADIIGYGKLQYTADTDHGLQSWMLAADWAELVFALWALARHTAHPQWIDGSWFPFETMRQRAAHYGRSVPSLNPPG